DAYGALAGEHALQVTAGLLSAELSHWDLLARYSDTQFALLLTNRSQHGCVSLCERLRHTIEEAEFLESRVTISIGCTTCQLAEQQSILPTQSMVIQQTKQALRDAQNSGGNNTMHKDISYQISEVDGQV
ncbi:MAG: diguanylate cyclase domain-containing protein, partial [Enterobacteriaceae bacterium]